MTRQLRTTLTTLAAIVLGGCGIEAQQVTSETMSGTTPYTTDLARGYQELARSRYSGGDYDNADRFARRALYAEAGIPTKPESIGARALSQDAVTEMTADRVRLVAAQSRQIAFIVPADAAEAQVSFDCMMEQLERTYQPYLASCRQKFADAMTRIDQALTSQPAPSPTTN